MVPPTADVDRSPELADPSCYGSATLKVFLALFRSHFSQLGYRIYALSHLKGAVVCQ